MSFTNYPHGITSFGIPILGMGNGPLPVPGNVYFVHPAQDATLGVDKGVVAASDSNPGTLEKPLASLSQAHSGMTANQNDTAILIGNSSASATNVVSESSAVTWSKNLCHIIGTAMNRVSHRCSIRQANSDIANFITVSADGCVFANFHVFSDDDTNEAEIAWTETGQRNAHYNLHIAGMANTGASNPRDAAGSRNIKLTGDGERYFKDCVIGVDTADRGAANASLECASQAVRDIFEDCRFIMRADAATPLFVTIGASGLDRFIEFKDCAFHNFAGTSLTQAMSINGSAGGNVIIRGAGTILVGADEWDSGDSAYINLPAAASTGGEGTTVADS